MPNKRLLVVGNIGGHDIERLADLGYAAEVVPSLQDAARFEGVRACLAQHRQESIDVIAAGLLDAAKNHSNGALRDDAAIVVFRLGDRSSGGGEAE